MIFSASGRQFATMTPIALACAATVTFSLCGAAQAQSPAGQTLAPVVVSGARFPNDPAFSPVGATIITADDIRSAGVDNVNEAIRKIGGVYGRQNVLGTADFSLDLGGFGDTSDQNIVVLLDGVRLSENEQAIALLSTIPIETVERIEIVRGGSSVLYGDGATGGTIQIITKRPSPGAVHGTIVGEVGSYGSRGIRASVAKDWDGFAIDANYSKQRSDNYRDNNASSQENFSGGMQWASSEGRLGLRIDTAHNDYRLAGPLTYAQYQLDARQTATPNDFGSYDSNRITLFAERRIGAFEFAAELAHREKIAKMYQVFPGGFTSNSEVHSRVTQFSPRLRHVLNTGSLKNEVVAGLDFSEWDLNDSISKATAGQRSRAIYLRDEIQFNQNARIAVGVRHEVFDKNAQDPNTFASSYQTSQSLNAWDVQASYAVIPVLRLFGKGGQSYRVANVDDNRYTNPLNQALQPQISHDLEFGATLGRDGQRATLKWFQHRLTNEIMFNPVTFTNINLDPTKRQGVELEGSVRLNGDFTASASLRHVRATFREGTNAGKDVVLVPKNVATARLNWTSGIQSANVGVQWVDTQRYGNDFANTCAAVMPSFTTIDARYAVRFSGWELAVSGDNLLDKKYFSRAYGCQGNIYPDAGRLLKFTARYDF